MRVPPRPHFYWRPTQIFFALAGAARKEQARPEPSSAPSTSPRLKYFAPSTRCSFSREGGWTTPWHLGASAFRARPSPWCVARCPELASGSGGEGRGEGSSVLWVWGRPMTKKKNGTTQSCTPRRLLMAVWCFSPPAALPLSACLTWAAGPPRCACVCVGGGGEAGHPPRGQRARVPAL